MLGYKRITSALIISLALAFSLGIVWNGLFHPHSGEEQAGKYPFYVNLENFAREHLPFRDHFRSLAIRLKLAGGQSQQDGVFIGNDILLENIQPPTATYVEKNIHSLLDFVQDSAVPVYAMIIPGKCAIKQQQIPSAEYVQLFNQKDFIEQISDAFSGEISMVDAYSALFSNQGQYIYYRTDPNLTGLGAYYVYATLASRLNVRPLDISKFSIQHLSHEFYGSTYQKFPFSQVSGDVLSLYRLREEDVYYSVRHNNHGQPYTYPMLYPAWQNRMGNPLGVYLGGNTGDMEIRTYNNGSADRRLLIFGDDSMMQVLPFLASSFDEIRFVDLSKLDETEIFSIDVFYYDQVVFAYSLDTFAHTDNPSRIIYS